MAVVQYKSDQVQNLKLFWLNDSQKLIGKIAALEDHKKWVMAVASGQVYHVEALFQAVLKHGSSIRTLVNEYKCTAEIVYCPRGHTQDEILKSLALLRLGGARVADFAHCALSLPSITIACCNSKLQPLVVSVSQPTVQEVDTNIWVCTEMLEDYTTKNVSDKTANIENKIIHQVLMLDEIAVEKWLHWDDKTNMFVRICQEHGHGIPLEFCSEADLNLLCDLLDKGMVHLASEVSSLPAQQLLV